MVGGRDLVGVCQVGLESIWEARNMPCCVAGEASGDGSVRQAVMYNTSVYSS